jgi:hypothetical protein
MNLQEFVTQALTQIAHGIRDADTELLKAGAIVNPRHVQGAGMDKSNVYGYIAPKKDYQRAVHSVEFDVAVTAAEGKETKGGIGIVVGVIGLGSQGRSEESSTSVSRIKFRVPVALPNSGNES